MRRPTKEQTIYNLVGRGVRLGLAAFYLSSLVPTPVLAAEPPIERASPPGTKWCLPVPRGGGIIPSRDGGRIVSTGPEYFVVTADGHILFPGEKVPDEQPDELLSVCKRSFIY